MTVDANKLHPTYCLFESFDFTELPTFYTRFPYRDYVYICDKVLASLCELYSRSFRRYPYLIITFYHKPSVVVVSVGFSLRIKIISFIFGWKIYNLPCVQQCICQQNFSTAVIKNIFRDINFTVITFKRVVIKSFIDYNTYT
jgi:hypothetical protein